MPPRAATPAWLPPMLATLSDEAEFDRLRTVVSNWILERKLDGFRALAFRAGDSVRLLSRNQKNLGDRFPEIEEALRRQPLDQFIVDGEVVALDQGGRNVSFERLQQRLKATTLEGARRSGVRLVYFAFDLLHAHGHDTRALPLLERKRLLKQALDFNPRIRLLPHFKVGGSTTLAKACARGWEGLIAKNADGPYEGRRSKAWLKLKCDNRQEFVIGGWTDPAGSRIGFGALLLGYYEAGTFVYAGKVGTGYSDALLRSLQARLAKDEVKERPFGGPPDPELPRKAVHWVKPKLVAEVVFTEWTADGKLRHPRFLGLRPDKAPRDVVRERKPSERVP